MGSLSTTKALTAVSRGGGAVSLTGYQAREGDVLTYTVSVTETGSTASATTVLTETVPAHTSYTGSAEGWALAGSNYTQTVTAPAGTTVSKTFTVTVGALANGVTAISNTVSASSGVCTSCTVASATAPRLSISKVGPATLPAGGTVRYTVTVANGGGSATSGALAFTDSLPTGLTFSSQASGSASLVCAPVGQIVTCDNVSTSASIAAGSSITVSYDAAVADDVSGTLVNGVILTSLGGDDRTPAAISSYADPASGASNQGADGLSAKAAAAASHGTLTVSKDLIKVNNVTHVSGAKINPGVKLLYAITLQESGGVASATTTLTETAPAHTSYTGTLEGWQGSGPFTQSVLVPAGQTVTKYFTVTADSFDTSVVEIANTVTTSYGTCSPCLVKDPTVNASNGSLGGKAIRKTRTGEQKLAGVVVKLYDASGSVIATTTTDTQGTYTFSNLVPDTYTIKFSKESGSLGFQTDNSGTQGIDQIQSVSLGSGQSLTSLNAVAIDPSGVVYNSVTRNPVAGATVTLRYNGGPVPDSWLNQTLGGANNQVTDATGAYNFVLNGTAPSSNNTNAYSLVVQPPANFKFQSTLIPPSSTTPYDPGTGGATILIQSQATAPASGQDTTYYLSFYFNSTGAGATLSPSNGVANNHIPLDPVGTLSVAKSLSGVSRGGNAVSLSGYQVRSGDVLTYTVSVTE
ncbi:MAG: hypothetical protein RLZZ84_1728, partial [Pseudomonadota bacterium]